MKWEKNYHCAPGSSKQFCKKYKHEALYFSYSTTNTSILLTLQQLEPIHRFGGDSILFVVFLQYKDLQVWGKVHIFWEGHKILRNLHLTSVLCCKVWVFWEGHKIWKKSSSLNFKLLLFIFPIVIWPSSLRQTLYPMAPGWFPRAV